MKTIDKKELEDKALEFARQKKQWHYHLLTPTCKFNDQKKHAFVLENNSDKQYFVFYDDKPAMDLGKKLLSVLHGEDILKKNDEQQAISLEKQAILNKARQLNNEGKFWHHHVLFPNCIFNKHTGKWNITLEDQENNKILESVSENEPKDDQKKIEFLYYQQRTIV